MIKKDIIEKLDYLNKLYDAHLKEIRAMNELFADEVIKNQDKSYLASVNKRLADLIKNADSIGADIGKLKSQIASI